MQNEDPNTPANAENDRKGSLSRKLAIAGVASVVLLGAGAAAFASGDGPGRGHKFMRGFIEYRMEKMLEEAGANEDQQTKLKNLVNATIDEVRPERSDRREMRDAMVKLLEAPVIDRTAIEALRVQQLAKFDEKSKIVAKAIGDAAEILTPEQRAALIKEMDDFGPRFGRW